MEEAIIEDVIMKINEISKQIYNNQRIIGSYFEGVMEYPTVIVFVCV